MLVSLDAVGEFQSSVIAKVWIPTGTSEDDAEAMLQATVCSFRHRGADGGLFLSTEDVSVLDVEHYADGTSEYILGWRPPITDTHVSLVGGSLHGSTVYHTDILNPIHYLVDGEVERYTLTGWNDGLHRWQFEFEAPTPLV